MGEINQLNNGKSSNIVMQELLLAFCMKLNARLKNGNCCLFSSFFLEDLAPYLFLLDRLKREWKT